MTRRADPSGIPPPTVLGPLAKTPPDARAGGRRKHKHNLVALSRAGASLSSSFDCRVNANPGRSDLPDFFRPDAMAALSSFLCFVHCRVRLPDQGIDRDALSAVQPDADA